jgi:hypothetical protein
MTEIIKKASQETVDRLTSPPAPYFKPFIPIGGTMAVIGICLKIVAAIFPATLPIALVSLAPELISIGTTMFIGAGLTKDQNQVAGKTNLLGKLINMFKK